MGTLILDAFPEGKRKALVMSYDDGVVQDRRLVEIFNRHGIRGTFHLNSGHLGRDKYLTAAELRSLFTGHEVSCHTVNHPHLPHLPNEWIIREIMDDRRALEAAVGYTVRGMSYPGGGFDDRVVSLLPMLGIEYARAVLPQWDFLIPNDFLRWPPTCHHGEAHKHLERFQKLNPYWATQVFYVYGHSYEFDRNDGWAMIEDFCAKAGRDPSVWYTTQIDLVDYMSALRRARCSVDRTFVENASGIPIWVRHDHEAIKIEPGSRYEIG